MPSLASVVKEIVLKDTKAWAYTQGRFPGLCHQATLFWLIMAKRGIEATPFEIAQADPILQDLKQCGRQVLRANFSPPPAPGTVVMFLSNGAPKHSCVIKDSDTLGGYNQVGWLPGGQSTRYTQNKLGDLPWIDMFKVSGTVPSTRYDLWIVTEGSALGNLEFYIKKHVK
jgi:hypothetical protein